MEKYVYIVYTKLVFILFFWLWIICNLYFELGSTYVAKRMLYWWRQPSCKKSYRCITVRFNCSFICCWCQKPTTDARNWITPLKRDELMRCTRCLGLFLLLVDRPSVTRFSFIDVLQRQSIREWLIINFSKLHVGCCYFCVDFLCEL